MPDEDPRTTPWHPSHLPATSTDPSTWTRRCREWCEHLSVAKSGETLRTHLECSKCGFGFIVRTSYYSYSTNEDVHNWGTCCNPDCRHAWEEIS
jgi:hypothetical protein